MNNLWLWAVFLPRKVNSFLDKINPTEAQMAAYIDTMRDKLWPESPAGVAPPQSPRPPRTDEDKNEAKDRAHHLINAKCRQHFPEL